MNNNELLVEIGRIVRESQRGVVAFLGSGLSLPEYLGWEDLVKTLCERCGQPFEAADSEDRRARATRLMELADLALDRNQERYAGTLRECFPELPRSRSRVAYEYLSRLPFLAYVTTNLDPLLAFSLQSHAEARGFGGVYAYPDMPYLIRAVKRPAYYLHGRVEGSDDNVARNVILGKRSFDRAYTEGRGNLRSLLEQLFTHQDVVFIGYSLEDPFFQALLERCAATKRDISEVNDSATPPRWHAVLPSRPDKEQAGAPFDGTAREKFREAVRESETASALRGLDILPAYYDPEDEFHSGLDRVLEEWCGAQPVPTSHDY